MNSGVVLATKKHQILMHTTIKSSKNIPFIYSRTISYCSLLISSLNVIKVIKRGFDQGIKHKKFAIVVSLSHVPN